MKVEDYPNYYVAGDAVSLKSQSAYLRLVRWDLTLMIISAGLTIYNFQTDERKLIVYLISAVILIIALVISVLIKVRKHEDTWYRGRALAESCKTLTWRFMMCSEFFEGSLSTNDVESRFINRIRELSNEFSDLNGELAASRLNSPLITDKMRNVRARNLAERKKFYIEQRIRNQIEWYSSKADLNKTKYENWFLVVIVCQVLSLFSIGFLVKYPSSNLNLVGFFSTISASVFSWIQLKKFQENKEAYTTATSELNLIIAESNTVFTDDDFSKYVLDSENAMSREHTMWLAQKRL